MKPINNLFYNIEKLPYEFIAKNTTAAVWCLIKTHLIDNNDIWTDGFHEIQKQVCTNLLKEIL